MHDPIRALPAREVARRDPHRASKHLHLRDYKHQGKEQPLIVEAHERVQVRRRVFTGKRWPHDDEERVVTEREVRLRLTPFGRTFYQQHWHHYRHLYPKVEAPEPEQAESEANP